MSGDPRPAGQLPEPARFWVRWTPRAWPAPETPWVHLGEGRLGEPANQASLALGGPPVDDVLYIPPVPRALAAERDHLARARLADGTPVLIQALAGDDSPDAPGATVVWDPLAALLAGDLAPLGSLPAGSVAVWPLLPGLTDDPDLWRRGCELLATAGICTVQALAPRLDPSDRRRLLSQVGDEAFEALFHGEPPAERPFAVLAHGFGLSPFLPRPLPRPPISGADARRLAGALALIAELWLRLGRPVSQGQAFFAAARAADRTSYDLPALAREGNLSHLSLDPASQAVVEDWSRTGDSDLLAELLAEYLSPLSP